MAATSHDAPSTLVDDRQLFSKARALPVVTGPFKRSARRADAFGVVDRVTLSEVGRRLSRQMVPNGHSWLSSDEATPLTVSSTVR
jgi:hypothetical protein